MNTLCPMSYAKLRAIELGYDSCRFVHRELQLEGFGTQKIEAFNELWILLEADTSIAVESSYGRYAATDTTLNEQMHEHADALVVTNTIAKPATAKFLQVLLQL